MSSRVLVVGVFSFLLGAGCGDSGGDGDDAFTTAPTAGPGSATESMTGDGSTSMSGSSNTMPMTTETMTMTSLDATGENMEVDAFRFTEVYVRDPHFYGDTLIGCIDITDMTPLGADGSVNGQFNVAINGDMNPNMTPDGILDLSLMLLFRPIDQTEGASGEVEFANGDCVIPAEATLCELKVGTEFFPAPTINMGGGSTCHMADPTHLGGYSPPPAVTPGPCFHAGPAAVTIITAAFNLPLENAEIAASWVGDPADGLMSGTLRGFLTRAAAEAATLPESLVMQVNKPNVAGLMAGHATCCETTVDDTDGDGWWFYADFSAERVPWIGE